MKQFSYRWTCDEAGCGKVLEENSLASLGLRIRVHQHGHRMFDAYRAAATEKTPAVNKRTLRIDPDLWQLSASDRAFLAALKVDAR